MTFNFFRKLTAEEIENKISDYRNELMEKEGFTKHEEKPASRYAYYLCCIFLLKSVDCCIYVIYCIY